MIHLLRRCCLLLAVWQAPFFSSAQTIQLSMPDTTVLAGDTLSYPIVVGSDFDRVVSAQFSIQWNPSVLRYIGHLPVDLNQIAVGETSAAQGALRFSWFDVGGQGITLAPGSQLVRFRFRAEGQPGDSTPVVFTNEPLRIQIFRAGSTPGLFDSLVLVQDTGLVKIARVWQPTAVSQNPTCFGMNDGTASVNAADAPAGAQFLWTGPNGFSSSSPVLSDLGPGAYNLVATSSQGEVLFETTITLNEPPPLQPDLGDDLQLCPGESSTLSPGTFAGYLWSDGTTAAQLPINQTGTYSVTVNDAQGCTASDTIAVNVSADVQIVVENDRLSICPGDSVQLRVSGGETYRWTDPSNTLSSTTIPNPVAKPQQSSSYTLIASNECASDTIQFSIFVHQTDASAGPDTCIQRGQELRLYARGGVRYAWDRGEYPLNSYSSSDPLSTPLSSTVYRVEIVDANGCKTTIEVPVTVVDGAPDILLINMITPNGDGRNDVLEFQELGKFTNNALKVYNRWGDLAYQKLGYQTDDERFDGTWNGKPLPAGNYFYVLSFSEVHYKQTLTIIRD
jgi:gliding motility-associated-like protein